MRDPNELHKLSRQRHAEHAPHLVMIICLTLLSVYLALQLRDVAIGEPLPEPAATCQAMAAKYRCVIVRGFDGYGRDYEVSQWCKEE